MGERTRSFLSIEQEPVLRATLKSWLDSLRGWRRGLNGFRAMPFTSP